MSKFLSVLTSPFWGPEKIDAFHAVSEETLKVANTLSEEAKKTQETANSILEEVQKENQQQKIEYEAIRNQADRDRESLKSLTESASEMLRAARGDREEIVSIKELVRESLKKAENILGNAESTGNQNREMTEQIRQSHKNVQQLMTNYERLIDENAHKEELFNRNAQSLLMDIQKSKQSLDELQVITKNTLDSSQEAFEEGRKLRQTAERLVGDVQNNYKMQIQQGDTLKEQVAANVALAQNIIQAAQALQESARRDREEVTNLKVLTERSLQKADEILAESNESKKQAELLLQEHAKQEDLALLVGDNQKKRAAMALNLCATSITTVLKDQNLQSMEREYNAILNNINLQKIVKDEALLSTMRSILDTISFFRLAEKERELLKKQHDQRMNNLLWTSLNSVS